MYITKTFPEYSASIPLNTIDDLRTFYWHLPKEALEEVSTGFLKSHTISAPTFNKLRHHVLYQLASVLNLPQYPISRTEAFGVSKHVAKSLAAGSTESLPSKHNGAMCDYRITKKLKRLYQNATSSTLKQLEFPRDVIEYLECSGCTTKLPVIRQYGRTDSTYKIHRKLSLYKLQSPSGSLTCNCGAVKVSMLYPTANLSGTTGIYPTDNLSGTTRTHPNGMYGILKVTTKNIAKVFLHQAYSTPFGLIYKPRSLCWVTKIPVVSTVTSSASKYKSTGNVWSIEFTKEFNTRYQVPLLHKLGGKYPEDYSAKMLALKHSLDGTKVASENISIPFVPTFLRDIPQDSITVPKESINVPENVPIASWQLQAWQASSWQTYTPFPGWSGATSKFAPTSIAGGRVHNVFSPLEFPRFKAACPNQFLEDWVNHSSILFYARMYAMFYKVLVKIPEGLVFPSGFYISSSSAFAKATGVCASRNQYADYDIPLGIPKGSMIYAKRLLQELGVHPDILGLPIDFAEAPEYQDFVVTFGVLQDSSNPKDYLLTPTTYFESDPHKPSRFLDLLQIRDPMRESTNDSQDVLSECKVYPTAIIGFLPLYQELTQQVLLPQPLDTTIGVVSQCELKSLPQTLVDVGTEAYLDVEEFSTRLDALSSNAKYNIHLGLKTQRSLVLGMLRAYKDDKTIDHLRRYTKKAQNVSYGIEGISWNTKSLSLRLGSPIEVYKLNLLVNGFTTGNEVRPWHFYGQQP